MREIAVDKYIPKVGERFEAFDAMTGKPHRCNPFVCNHSQNIWVGGGSFRFRTNEWRFRKIGKSEVKNESAGRGIFETKNIYQRTETTLAKTKKGNNAGGEYYQRLDRILRYGKRGFGVFRKQ